LPANGVIIKGQQCSGSTFAYIYAHPSNIPYLDSGQETELTEKEFSALNAIVGIKSSYRPDYFMQNRLGPYGPKNPLLLTLAEKGLIRITGAGIQATTEGKNVKKKNKEQIYAAQRVAHRYLQHYEG